jgi:hypothetical protein
MDRYQVELRPQGFAVVDQRRPNRTWRARMAERETKRTAPRAVSTTVDASPLDEVAKAAAARKRAESRVARAVRQAKEAGVSVAEVASQLGMTRQGVYAMLARS